MFHIYNDKWILITNNVKIWGWFEIFHEHVTVIAAPMAGRFVEFDNHFFLNILEYYSHIIHRQCFAYWHANNYSKTPSSFLYSQYLKVWEAHGNVERQKRFAGTSSGVLHEEGREEQGSRKF